MAFFHLVFNCFLNNRLAWLISFIVVITFFILNRLKKIDLSGILPLKLLIVCHIIFHLAVELFNITRFPLWFIWLELIAIFITLVINLSSYKMLKGLLYFSLGILYFIAMSFIIEMGFCITDSSAKIIMIIAVLYLTFSFWQKSWVIFWFPRLLLL